MTPAAPAPSGHAHARALLATAGWAVSLVIPLALVVLLVCLDAIDPLIGSLAFGVASWLAWAAIRFAQAPLRSHRTALHPRRWRWTALHHPH